jgi:hypothetical protein
MEGKEMSTPSVSIRLILTGNPKSAWKAMERIYQNNSIGHRSLNCVNRVCLNSVSDIPLSSVQPDFCLYMSLNAVKSRSERQES